MHKPDFEFANFLLTELLEVAATMDESLGFEGAPIRDAKCSAINSWATKGFVRMAFSSGRSDPRFAPSRSQTNGPGLHTPLANVR